MLGGSKEESMSNPRQRALKLALRVLSSETAACDRLGASALELQLWLSGDVTPPVEVLMRALDVILDDPALAARHAITLAAHEKESSLSTLPH
jgi:hypothetical protein